jgi:hypothetical protein
VVAGDREDRPVVVPERLVELVVVVLALAEVVDDVAEVEEERRPVGTAGRDVVCHRIGDARLVGDRGRRGLGAVDLGRAGVADGVEDDLVRGDDRPQDRVGQDVGQVEPRRCHVRSRDGLQLASVQQVVRRLVVAGARVVELESRFVGGRLRLSEESAVDSEQVADPAGSGRRPGTCAHRRSSLPALVA